jgi:hypothetical protein
MDDNIINKVRDYCYGQLNMINAYSLNNKGCLTETEAIQAITGRKTLTQVITFLDTLEKEKV